MLTHIDYKICVECRGKIPESRNSITCSDECKNKRIYKQRHPISHIETQLCDTCDDYFVKRYNRKSCSKECRIEREDLYDYNYRKKPKGCIQV